jgi:hypothetical protein
VGGARRIEHVNHLILIKPATKYAKAVMPDLIRHPAPAWIPAFAGMTNFNVFNCRINKT